MTDSLDGLLLVDKPSGWTSFDVVAKVRGTIKRGTGIAKPKVGHTGTLDPLATGLLVLTVGTYCKRAAEFSKLDKSYDVEVTLGQTSTTDDGEGEKQPVSGMQPSEDAVKNTVKTFVGEQLQTPPVFSAIKVGGQRAYKLARSGKDVAMEPRNITVYEISSLSYEYPVVTFTARVSSGTYLRSLARDIGDKLGTGAFMSGLRRTSVGSFKLDEAMTIDDMSIESISSRLLQYSGSEVHSQDDTA